MKKTNRVLILLGVGLVGLLGLISLAAIVALGLQLYIFRLETTHETNTTDVVACLTDLHYERSRTAAFDGKTYSVPIGQISLELLNLRDTAVMVTKIDINPAGMWANGQPGGLGTIYIPINQQIAAHDRQVINNLDFDAGFQIEESTWVEVPEAVYIRAYYWPNGYGARMSCFPDGGLGWNCPNGLSNGEEINNVCDKE